MRLGTLNRHVEVQRQAGRWPTIRGENPPQGVQYQAITIWLWPSSFTVHVRWYRWRNK